MTKAVGPSELKNFLGLRRKLGRERRAGKRNWIVEVSLLVNKNASDT